MGYFILDWGEDEGVVRVNHPDDLTRTQVEEFDGFKTWIDTLRASLKQQKYPSHPFHEEGYKLKKVEIKEKYMIGKRPLFMYVEALVESKNGDRLPGVAFLRGGAVAVLIILRPSDSPDERYVVMTEQARIPAGSLSFMEIPAGMLDPKDGNKFDGAAAREIKEEIGLVLKEEDLTNMTEIALKGEQTDELLQRAMYPSPGGCDEYISIFLWEREMDRMQIEGLRGRLTGIRSEKERITVRLLNYEKLLQVGARDVKTLAAWALYEYLKRTRQIDHNGKEVVDRPTSL